MGVYKGLGLVGFGISRQAGEELYFRNISLHYASYSAWKCCCSGGLGCCCSCSTCSSRYEPPFPCSIVLWLKDIDVSTNVLGQLNLFAQYAAASYCTNNINSTGDGLSCLEGNCPSVQSAKTTTIYEFDEYVCSSLELYTCTILTTTRSTEFGDVAGFLAADQTNKLLVLSFRGSRTLSTWIANLDFGLTDSSLCSDCEVHGGFWKAWETVADDVTAKIKTALTTYSGYTLVLTGHSFGAAVATLGGTVLRNAGYKLELVSVTTKHEPCYISSQ
jgi:hypothetical protein